MTPHSSPLSVIAVIRPGKRSSPGGTCQAARVPGAFISNAIGEALSGLDDMATETASVVLPTQLTLLGAEPMAAAPMVPPTA